MMASLMLEMNMKPDIAKGMVQQDDDDDIDDMDGMKEATEAA